MVATYPIVIEEMTVDDIPAVQLVENASFPVPWPANAFRHELTQNRNAHYIVAKEEEHIVGYAGLWLSLDEAHITTFAVLPDYRRRKIGERMLVDLFARAEKLGAEWLTLEVRASNIPAQKLYRYSSQLRSLTGGRGVHQEKFSHYAEMPHELEQRQQLRRR